MPPDILPLAVPALITLPASTTQAAFIILQVYSFLSSSTSTAAAPTVHSGPGLPLKNTLPLPTFSSTGEHPRTTAAISHS
ncbi:hypothetical protein RSJ15_01455 [Clostridium botulinum]|uniref:Uncharacterized protein n=1 Tax=Clostridium botulinum CFSAN001627 TaxID=1232189 RepID=M1ZU14_CLOBO|nr:hypothetical protein RSJ15_01455 [Clostridium botulinum]EKN43297.1 hypothetical protein CFSAN001627_01385 [Clostridium botulinum CFSAN001627]OSB12840.1 hypothetical protein B2H96_11285 [Clostridium botulinum]